MRRIKPTSFFSSLIVTLTISLIQPFNARAQDTNRYEFKLPGVSVESVSVAKTTDSKIAATVVVFVGTECPLAKLYATRLEEMQKEFDGEVRIVGVSSNQQDSIDDLKVFIKNHRIGFPIGKDFQNKVADQYDVKRTPEVVLLDRNLAIKYRGRIDDQYSPGISRKQPSKFFLADAIKQLLRNESIAIANTEPVGCLIGRVKRTNVESSVTYTNQVSRILQKHCIECHRRGEIGPFALTDYEEVVGWADMMAEVVADQRMPPWHANPEHGEFKNSRLMTAEEKKQLEDWAAAGAPYGNQSELPKPKSYISGWSLPKEPDIVISMRQKPYQVAATGTVEYQYFVVDPKFTEDKWIAAAQVLPGNAAVVHHSIVFVRPPDGGRFRGIGWLSAYVPGQRPIKLAKNRARLVPAGSKLVFQQHYTPNGKPEADITKIGLIFSNENDVDEEVLTLAGLNQEFEIPPNTDNHIVAARLSWLPKSGKLLTVTPHMHLRGKSFRAFVEIGELKEVICDVPNYDFNWQHTYEFARPIELSSLGSIHFDVTFDNSENNPVNPDAQERVTWGDQTNEEMAVAFFDVAVPRDLNEKKDLGASPQNKKAKEDLTKPKSEKVTAYVDKFFKRFDKDSDGFVKRSELPISTRSFSFWQFDLDNNQKLSRDELIQITNRRLK